MTTAEIIQMSASKLEMVRILYMNKKGVTKKIVVEPYEIRYDRNKGRVVFWAWNVQEGHIAQFFMDKIMAAEFTFLPFLPKFPVKL